MTHIGFNGEKLKASYHRDRKQIGSVCALLAQCLLSHSASSVSIRVFLGAAFTGHAARRRIEDAAQDMVAASRNTSAQRDLHQDATLGRSPLRYWGKPCKC